MNFRNYLQGIEIQILENRPIALGNAEEDHEAAVKGDFDALYAANISELGLAHHQLAYQVE